MLLICCLSTLLLAGGISLPIPCSSENNDNFKGLQIPRQFIIQSNTGVPIITITPPRTNGSEPLQNTTLPSLVITQGPYFVDPTSQPINKVLINALSNALAIFFPLLSKTHLVKTSSIISPSNDTNSSTNPSKNGSKVNLVNESVIRTPEGHTDEPTNDKNLPLHLLLPILRGRDEMMASTDDIDTDKLESQTNGIVAYIHALMQKAIKEPLSKL